jgi:multiple sugar transport system permease protein
MRGSTRSPSAGRAAAGTGVTIVATWPSRLGRDLDRHAGWVFPAPAVIALAALVGAPMAFNLFLSLQDWFVAGQMRFIGIGNFQRLIFDDEPFRWAVWRTLYFTALAVTAQLVLGMAIALLLHREFRGRALLRSVFVLPMVTTPVAVGMVWVLLFDPVFGPLNYMLISLGLEPLEWLSDVNLVIPALALVDTWQYTPFVVVVLLAGLAALPVEPYESARVDGANALQSFWYLTLPLLRPTIMVAVLFRVIDSLKNFDVIYVMTQGGPGRASETLNLYNFKVGFEFFHLGYAAAIALVLTGLVFGFSALILRARRVD